MCVCVMMMMMVMQRVREPNHIVSVHIRSLYLVFLGLLCIAFPVIICVCCSVALRRI